VHAMTCVHATREQGQQGKTAGMAGCRDRRFARRFEWHLLVPRYI
jgi:hypothetical protein